VQTLPSLMAELRAYKMKNTAPFYIPEQPDKMRILDYQDEHGETSEKIY
jgi:hypothetical protein